MKVVNQYQTFNVCFYHGEKFVVLVPVIATTEGRALDEARRRLMRAYDPMPFYNRIEIETR